MIPLKNLIAKLFGFHAEIKKYQSRIDELNRQIQDLSWDDVFGMWTRGAFLQFCSVMPRGKRVVVFIDLDDIHDLNQEYGYTEIDRRIKNTFSIPFRRSDVVARWYSGDEIVILFDSDIAGVERKMHELIKSAAQQDLSFQYEMCIWDVSEKPITDVVDILSGQLFSRTAGSKARKRKR